MKNLKSANLLSIENDTIEQVNEITRGVISRLLTKQAEETDVPESCPKCSKPFGQKSPQGRSLLSKRGRVNFKTDVCHCEACHLDFFPQFRILGCDVDQEHSPAVLKKVTIASTRDRSFSIASSNLADLAELDVPAKQCQRFFFCWQACWQSKHQQANSSEEFSPNRGFSGISVVVKRRTATPT